MTEFIGTKLLKFNCLSLSILDEETTTTAYCCVRALDIVGSFVTCGVPLGPS